MRKKNNKKLIVYYVIVGLLYLLSFLVIFLAQWGKATFNASMEEIIFTLANPVKGSNTSVVKESVFYCANRLVVVLFIYSFWATIDFHKKTDLCITGIIKKKIININISKFIRVFTALNTAIVLAFGIMKVDAYFGMFDYLKLRAQSTTIYEDYYVDPSKAQIKLKEGNEYRNLIYIYLESMETSYTIVENGGMQDTCYIPNLVNYANQNISFSNTDKFGGFSYTPGTSWTMGAIFSSTSGIPFSYPIGENDMSQMTNFAPKLTGLGDILDSFGYSQYFLCGSDAEFGGRKKYFEQHGNYEILDLYYARKQGYIAEDYFKWWGFEDKVLFDIAKQELLKISANDEPFNFTMLTVDTHHEGGYMCDLCENTYDRRIKNVLTCTDKQVYAFVEWCKTQDFYENTTIILTGDHTRMDTHIVEGVERKDRTVYNCFINANVSGIFDTKNRIFTILDILPTTVAALGFEWSGDMLGLGTSLFSKTKTLPERRGLEVVQNELSKYSDYYVENFY